VHISTREDIETLIAIQSAFLGKSHPARGGEALRDQGGRGQSHTTDGITWHCGDRVVEAVVLSQLYWWLMDGRDGSCQASVVHG